MAHNSNIFEWRFRVTPGIIPQPLLETAYFAGWGRVPRLTQTTILKNELIIHSESYSSGTVHVPMFHVPLGITMESTESLQGRREHYSLLKELARGALGRFYRRLFDWQMLGFQQPKEFDNRMRCLAKRFSSVVVQDSFSQETEREFAAILDDLAPLIVDENKEFAEQSLSWRIKNNERLPVTLGIGMNIQHLETLHDFDPYAKLLQNSFHAVLPMPTWRELEPQQGQFNWERLEKQLMLPARFGFRTVLGPLLSFCTDGIPDWLLPDLAQEGHFESCASRFVNTMAERYGYLAHSWILANRFLDQTLPAMQPERSLSIVRLLAQQLRSRGIEMPIIAGISQPWGEYALRRLPEWEQVQIAETLMSCRDIDGFLLEMNFGNGDYQTLPRDPMCVGNMIDQWSFLGKKVYVSLTVPSAGNPIATKLQLSPEMQWSEERQRIWTETLLLTLLSKRKVRGVFWSCLQDPMDSSGSMPGLNSGLINAHQTLKSAFKHFSAARKNLLR